jgi:RES domain-containing protein
MVLWRISNHNDLSGLGGERSDGRWHTAARGKRIVYLTEHPAVALVETFVNQRGNPALFPERYQLLKVGTAEGLGMIEIAAAMSTAELRETQAMGDAWLAGGESALLRVPSVASPESWNYLLNPMHRDSGGLKVEWVRSIPYDKRLFRVKGI